MNWVIVVVFIVFFMSAVNWLVDGRKNYQGPENVEHLLASANQAARLANNLKNAERRKM